MSLHTSKPMSVNSRYHLTQNYVFPLETMTIVYPSFIEASIRSDSIEITSKKQFPTINSFRVTKKGHQLGNSYSILTVSLPKEESLPSPLHYNEKWEKEYDAFLNEQKNNNKWEDPIYVQKRLSKLLFSTLLIYSFSDEYSAFIRNKNDGGGYTYIYGKNICYNTRSEKYVFLYDQKKRHLTNPTDAFRYGWHYSNTQRSRSNISAYWVDEEAYITQPFTIRHIYHFVESLNFLWLKLQYINEFPVVSKGE